MSGMPPLPTTHSHGSLIQRLGMAVLLLACGCRNDHARVVRVFAAASLTAPFTELAQAFETSNPGVKVELHCAGTPRLVLQLREGAAADVFASADMVQMQRVADAGQTAGMPTVFAENQLVIITAKDNPKGIRSLADLQRPELSVLLCAPQVPAGRYAREVLQRAGVQVVSRSDEPSVRAIVSKVELGVVDAGIVYATDAQPKDPSARGKLHAVPIANSANITATYPIATLATGKQRALGTAFTTFVLSPPGQSILAAHGFASP